MKKFIEFGYFEGRVYYLSTRTGINNKIITKTCALRAKRIFFLSSPFSVDWDEQDKKASFEKAFLRNRGVTCDIYIQLVVQDEDFLVSLEKDIAIKEQERLDALHEDEEESEEESSSHSSEFTSYRIRPSKIKALANIAITKALSYSKIKYKLLAKTTFDPGYIPLLAWFIVEDPLPVFKTKGCIHDNFCESYYRSLCYNFYVCELPFMLENMTFDNAVTKIQILEKHEHFSSYQIKFKLIGLIETDDTNEVWNEKYLYAPFGHYIKESHHRVDETESNEPKVKQVKVRGMFIANHPKIQQLLKDKTEGDKMLREIQTSLNLKDKMTERNHDFNTSQVFFACLQFRLINQLDTPR